jgi:hypothetical protein
MAEPDDIRRALRHPDRSAEPRAVGSGIARRFEWQGLWLIIMLPGDHFDENAIRVAQPHHAAAAGGGEIGYFDAFRRGKPMQVVDRGGAQPQRNKGRRAGFGNVQERASVTAATVKSSIGSDTAVQPEIFEKASHCAEIGRCEADMRNVFDPDYRHCPNPIADDPSRPDSKLTIWSNCQT